MTGRHNEEKRKLSSYLLSGFHEKCLMVADEKITVCEVYV